MEKSLRSQKQDLVRDAIYAAAISLFTEKGFEQTTVEEVAQSAGVSRRSFFRYYASKDDLLAQNVLNYGTALVGAVKLCPQGMSTFEMLQKTVEAGVMYTNSRLRLTRQVIEIASRSTAARQAHLSRMMDVEDGLADAFAGRSKKANRDDMEPRLLAGVTVAIMNAAQAAWFMREHKDLGTCAERALLSLSSNLSRSATRSPAVLPAKRSRKAPLPVS